MEFLLFGILILVLLWPVMRIVGAIHSAKRQYNDLFNQARRAAGERRQAQPRKKRKVFSREEGEYVEFEDIEVSATYTQTNADGSRTSQSTTYREQQVTDVEWEDVKP